MDGCFYSGFQHTINGKKAITAIWEINYRDEEGTEKTLTSECVYPNQGNEFGGEGEGVNNILDYEWKENQWYRMVIHTWEDEQTGKTFLGQWILDIESGKWTLVSYFNTKLNTYINGGVYQFLENYWPSNSEEIRSFNIKNMYLKDIDKKDWISIDKTELSYDDPVWNYPTKGTHEFGSNNEYFYGSSGGTVENQQKYDEGSLLSLNATIKQFKKPNLGDFKIKSLSLNNDILSWKYDEFNNPQESVEIVIDYKNSERRKIKITRPEIREYNIDRENIEKIYVEAKDIYGQIDKSEVKNVTVNNQVSEIIQDTPKNDKNPSISQETDKDEEVTNSLKEITPKFDRVKKEEEKYKVENSQERVQNSIQKKSKKTVLMVIVVLAIDMSIVGVFMMKQIKNKKQG